MEAIVLDKLSLNFNTPENQLITEKTYIKKRMNLFLCVKCDMICAESIPEGKQRVYCLACDEYVKTKKTELIKHWLCCGFLWD